MWVWLSITAIILRRKQAHTHTHTCILLEPSIHFFFLSHTWFLATTALERRKTNCECASSIANNLIWSVDRVCIPCIHSHVPWTRCITHLPFTIRKRNGHLVAFSIWATASKLNSRILYTNIAAIAALSQPDHDFQTTHISIPENCIFSPAKRCHCMLGHNQQYSARRTPEASTHTKISTQTHSLNARRKYRRKLKQNGSLDLHSLLFLSFLTIFSPTCVCTVHTHVHRPTKIKRREKATNYTLTDWENVTPTTMTTDE